MFLNEGSKITGKWKPQVARDSLEFAFMMTEKVYLCSNTHCDTVTGLRGSRG